MLRIVGLALAVILSCSACGSGETTPNAFESQRFESERYGYALELPADWYVRGEAGGFWTPEELNYVGPGTDAFELDYPDRGTATDFPGITYGVYVSAAPVDGDLPASRGREGTAVLQLTRGRGLLRIGLG